MSIARARFEAFHEANPHIADRLEAMAIQWFNAGHDVVAIAMLWEVLRWTGRTWSSTDEPFMLPNNHKPHYARLLLERHPEWEDRIKTRELRAA